MKANRIAMVDFDYAMVGAAAVGCVLVDRLSEDWDNQMLLMGTAAGHEPSAPGRSEPVPDDLRMP